MSEKTVTAEIVVMGAGPGGYAAAFLAADLGMDVVLIDPNKNPGGVCLYRGCIPSKTFLNAARVIHEAAESEKWGVAFPKPVIDIHKLRSFKNNVVSKLTQGLGRLSAQRKITYIQGLAQFRTEHELIIQTDTGNTIACVFKNVIIATGSKPTKPAGLWEESPHILDSKRALELEDIPESLLVIGGGYIGLELGSVYATLGSKVTIAEITPSLLPGVDKDLVTVLKRRLDPLFDTIALKTRAHRFHIKKNGIEVTLTGSDEKSRNRLFNKVLVAVGRRPNSENIGLANTGIETDGLTKLIVETKTERILGLGIVGHGASEMIAEGVLAIEMGANVTDLKLSIHPHPTLTETVMESGDLFFNTATHFYKPRRKK